jgi:hypothetical protein
MSCHLINADTIQAFRFGTPIGVRLVIVAKGNCECPNLARITQAPMPIEPPEFNLETCDCPVIGEFPYVARGVFDLDASTVVVRTASGAKTVKVESVPGTEALAAKPAADDTVTGHAYFSSDVGKAFSDAVSQLQERFPGKTNAKVTEIGFVGFGGPIGIAFTFVTMQQQS